jgi:hypothetical protein
MVDPKEHARNLRRIAKTIAEIEAALDKTGLKVKSLGLPRSQARKHSSKAPQKQTPRDKG